MVGSSLRKPGINARGKHLVRKPGAWTCNRANYHLQEAKTKASRSTRLGLIAWWRHRQFHRPAYPVDSPFNPSQPLRKMTCLLPLRKRQVHNWKRYRKWYLNACCGLKCGIRENRVLLPSMEGGLPAMAPTRDYPPGRP